MQLRLWHRLFLAFAVLGVVALTTFAGLQARSFQQGFLDYASRLEREKIETAAQRLSDAYASHGSWQFLEGDTPQLLRTLQLDVPDDGQRPFNAPRPPDGQGPRFRDPPLAREQPADDQEPEFRPPPRDRRNPGFGPPPPRDGQGPRFHRPPPWRQPRPADAVSDPEANTVDAIAPADRWPDDRRPEDRADSAARRPPPRRGFGVNLRPRLLLLNATGEMVAGNPNVPRDAPAIDIVHDNAVVGQLLLAPLPQLRSDVDLDFARQQLRHMLWIAVAILLIALPLTWVLARWLLRPVRALAAGTRALSSGDYDTRIETGRSDELGDLARDFNALATALDQHRTARRQWGADIAHELRTPISVLSGEIQALQDGVRQVDAGRLASLQAECMRLRELVDDLYQLALSDAGALNYRFEGVDLAGIVREAVRAHTGVMQDAGLLLEAGTVPATCPYPHGDHARLRQLIDNLLGNALRYTDRPGRVIITLAPIIGGCRLRIDDSAPGVPDDALPRLFERLYRVEPSRSRKFGGAGLGLAICRNIVEAHGGTITAAHSPEGGLRVDIVFPER